MKNCLVIKLKADTGNFDLPRADYVVGRMDDFKFEPTNATYIRSVYNEDCELIIKGDGNFLDKNTLEPLPSPKNKIFKARASDVNNPIWLSGGKYQVLFPKKALGGIIEKNAPLSINLKDLHSVNIKTKYIIVKYYNATIQEFVDFAKLKNIALQIDNIAASFNTEQLADVMLYLPFTLNKNSEGDISYLHFVNWINDINIGGCKNYYGNVETFFDEHINRLNLSSKEGYFYTESHGVKFNGLWRAYWFYTILENGDCKIYSDSNRQTLVGTYSKETRQWTYQS